MTVAELQNLVIRHVLGVDDPRILNGLLVELEGYGERSAPACASVTLHEPAPEYGVDEGNPTGVSEERRPGPDEVLGTRPDGTPVTIANSAAQWGHSLDDFIENGVATDAGEDSCEMIESLSERDAQR